MLTLKAINKVIEHNSGTVPSHSFGTPIMHPRRPAVKNKETVQSGEPARIWDSQLMMFKHP